MAGKLVVTLENQADEFQRFTTAIEEFGRIEGIPDSVVFQVTLAVDELFTNIISYAYEDDGSHEIRIEMKTDGGAIEVDVFDDGVEFDPLQTEHKIPESLETAEIGGHGISIIRNFMDDVTYERLDELNHLKMVKSLKD